MTPTTGRSARGWASWGLVVALALGAGYWAGHQATRPPQLALPDARVVTTEVVNGSVEVTQAYGINVHWPASPVGVNGVEGTLTSLSVIPQGSVVSAGDVVYTVDLAPVLALKGDVPAFRELATGSRGADVTQLERFLRERGYLKGRADTHFDASTEAAVNRWYNDQNLPQDGHVPLGRVVFLPSLPSTLAPAAGIRLGARVSAGQELLVGATSQPAFSFRVLPEAVARTAQGMPVRIDAGGVTWQAEVERLAVAADDPDSTIAILRPTVGAQSICGSDCTGVIDLGGTSMLPGSLVVVPPTSGPQVPSAAIRTNASGGSCVMMEDGSTRPVTVKAASDDGRSIVDGVASGQRVVVAGKDVLC